MLQQALCESEQLVPGDELSWPPFKAWASELIVLYRSATNHWEVTFRSLQACFDG